MPHNSQTLCLSVQAWVKPGVMQVDQDLWTMLDESWDLIYCRYIIIVIIVINSSMIRC